MNSSKSVECQCGKIKTMNKLNCAHGKLNDYDENGFCSVVSKNYIIFDLGELN